jgi:hypothetical protein
MEKQILKLLDYKLKIDKREYALSYFKLRKYIKKNIKSYQNRKLNIKLIRELQNGVKNEYRSNFLTKRNSFWPEVWQKSDPRFKLRIMGVSKMDEWNL